MDTSEIVPIDSAPFFYQKVKAIIRKKKGFATMLKENYIVEKRNILNEMRENSMTFQEILFFSIYLSKINARDVSSREVKFPLKDFERIMGIERAKVSHLEKSFEGILQKVVSLPLENRQGFVSFQLFKECVLRKEEEEWIVTIDAHDRALPLMFEFKEKYFTYELWNVLKLKSKNQLRMYELLKQYENIGTRTVELVDLKEMLGLTKDGYEIWADFKRSVLDACQVALREKTDISFEYQPIRKGRKITAVKFIIQKNEVLEDISYIKQFLQPYSMETTEVPERKKEIAPIEKQKTATATLEEAFLEKNMVLFRDAVNQEFSQKEMDLIYHTMCLAEIPIIDGNYPLSYFHYLSRKYKELESRAITTTIKNRFAYFLKMIE